MKKILAFDMDGTIVDFYNVPNWLEMIRNENSMPYKIAKPLYNMVLLTSIVKLLKQQGWTIVVITWGCKNSSEKFDKIVAKIKKEWLEYYNFPYDKFYFQRYGTSKNSPITNIVATKILVDDNIHVRTEWKGDTINATLNIIPELQKLFSKSD